MSKPSALKLIDERITFYSEMGPEYKVVVADLKLIREKVENMMKHYQRKDQITEEVKELADKVAGIWKDKIGVQIKAITKLREALSARLGTFTDQEILAAVTQWATHVKTNEFYTNPDNKHHQKNIYLCLRDDARLEKALNLKVDEAEEKRPAKVEWGW